MDGTTNEPGSPQIVTVESGFINVSPVAFHMWAGDFLRPLATIRDRRAFQPAVLRLLCRAIELEMKSRLLVTATQRQ